MSQVQAAIPVTSSWFTKVDESIYQRIGISRGVARRQSGYRMYRKLQPGDWFRSTKSPREYMIRYQDEMLGLLKPDKVLEELRKMGGEKIPCLLCFEPPEPGPTWCHRGLVSAWFKDTLGLDVFEVGQEHEGAGWAHPKLHPTLRRDAPFPAGRKPVVPDMSARINAIIGARFTRAMEGKDFEYVIVGQDEEEADHVIVRHVGGLTDGRFTSVPFTTVEKYV